MFWTLHTSANLSDLGQKAGPDACDDVLRRVIGAVPYRRYDRNRTDYLKPSGQYDIAVSGRVETIALSTTLSLEGGCTILSCDGMNDFIQQHLLPQIPTNARGNRTLIDALHGKLVRPITIKTVVCARLGRGRSCLVVYTRRTAKLLKTFSFIDGVPYIFPPEPSLDMATVATAIEWLEERLGVEGISERHRYCCKKQRSGRHVIVGVPVEMK